MLDKLKRPFYVLAPMDDVTDTVFRQIVASCAAPDLCFSEFVNVDGLMSPGRTKLLPKLDHTTLEPPLIAHIWGLKPDNFYTVASQIASGQLASELGLKQNYAGIDLNMGCPAKQVVKVGACSALIKNPQLAKDIIQATKSGANGRLGVSVKTRIGYNKIEPAWIRFLLDQDLAMLSVHLRTTKEMSHVPAHYEELIWIKRQRDEQSPTTLLIANGDIANYAEGQKLASKYNLDGVMIGRGVFRDPYAFSQDSPWSKLAPKDKLALFERHLILFQDWAKNSDQGVKRLNKYAKIYINGFDGAKELREEIAQANTMSEMLTSLRNRIKAK